MRVLGLSAYYHDSAAALISEGKIVAAAQEERFTRKKHDARFPASAIRYCLDEGEISLLDIDYVVFYDKPLAKFDRLLETYLGFAPKGLRSFAAAMPIWLKEKLYLKTLLRNELIELSPSQDPSSLPKLLFNEHHESHAASAFYPSPFEKAAVLCMDGVGEWATTSVWLGAGNSLEPQWEIEFPHSIGLLYSAFTSYTGFKVNSGEYKLMGLAPFGEAKYAGIIRNELVDIKADGTFRLNMAYFDFATGLTMTNDRFARLFAGPPRAPETEITQREMDLAASIQLVTEEIVLQLGHSIHSELGVSNLCLAGGVALNCVANGRLLREGRFEQIWIQPAAGDAGGAVGAALTAWHRHLDRPRFVSSSDSMQGAFLGPQFETTAVASALNALGAVFTQHGDGNVAQHVATHLANGDVVGWFQGRMEFGPRSLGGRSILADPRNPKMQSDLNLKIKHRESFRPFAPSVLAEKVSEWFDLETDSPYMSIVAAVNPAHRIDTAGGEQLLFGVDSLKVPRSRIPAVTHVDYSARVQTVHANTNPRFHALLKAFEEQTGCAVLVNTSFNVRGEPIVCTPEHAYRCFMRTDIDLLVIEDVVLEKARQPVWEESQDWRDEFELD